MANYNSITVSWFFVVMRHVIICKVQCFRICVFSLPQICCLGGIAVNIVSPVTIYIGWSKSCFCRIIKFLSSSYYEYVLMSSTTSFLSYVPFRFDKKTINMMKILLLSTLFFFCCNLFCITCHEQWIIACNKCIRGAQWTLDYFSLFKVTCLAYVMIKSFSMSINFPLPYLSTNFYSMLLHI